MSILLGTNYYEAGADEDRRQLQSALHLSALSDVAPANLQWHDEPYERLAQHVRTVSVLRRDAREATGYNGRRKPLATEVFDALAKIARVDGHHYFGFLNADILVTQQAVDAILSGGRETYVFSRTDIDSQGQPLGLMLYGMDMFVCRVDVWPGVRRKLRPYIIGEQCFDNVYTAVMMSESDGAVVNRAGCILHERHESRWRNNDPYGEYNYFLASLDSRYFSMWVAYCERLIGARRQGASEADEEAIAKEAFMWRRSVAASSVQMGRQLKARFRHWRHRAR
jgi:hypothetical protein